MPRAPHRLLKHLRRLSVSAALLAGTAPAEIMSVSSERAIVREGPGAGYPSLWEEGRYAPFEVLSWRGDWARIKGVRGESGWAHRSVLSRQPAVVVTGRFARIRTGPGLAFPVAWTAGRHLPLKVERKEGGWLAVAAENGAAGWVYEKLVWGRVEAGSPPMEEETE